MYRFYSKRMVIISLNYFGSHREPRISRIIRISHTLKPIQVGGKSGKFQNIISRIRIQEERTIREIRGIRGSRKTSETSVNYLFSSPRWTPRAKREITGL